MWRERTYLYRYFDAQGHLLYVGITKDFFGRDSTRWVLPWRYKAARVTLEMFQNRRMAELAERTAIRDENAIHNRQRLAPVGEPNRYEQWFFVMQKGKMQGCRRIQLDYNKLELQRAEFLPCWSYEFFGKPLDASNA
ncbi:hypothetical protein PARHAE_00780 [Paracoccus haematequi]|uniref:GIY-YIG domain-containing protein n=2 Tax=Paracoccus haematequi TaxID=2491866 RepID=A0A447IJD9_9RHOB|nr:hypothetical protein PARHAE_00780 [Paracoccus haematequi]